MKKELEGILFIEQVFVEVIGATEVIYIKKNNWIEFTSNTNDDGDVLAIIQFKAKDWDRSNLIIFELSYNLTKDRFEYEDYTEDEKIVYTFNTWGEFKRFINTLEFETSCVDLMYHD